MVRRAGYEDLADNLESKPVSAAKLDELESTSRTMAQEGRRTVLHEMPEMLEGDKIEVGNIKFGVGVSPSAFYLRRRHGNPCIV